MSFTSKVISFSTLHFPLQFDATFYKLGHSDTNLGDQQQDKTTPYQSVHQLMKANSFRLLLRVSFDLFLPPSPTITSLPVT